jgi:predicted nucleic acid-binding protein
MRVPAFRDSSALVPLCVGQALTYQATIRYRSHDIVVWWTTPVEIAGALARLVRMNQLDASDWTRASNLAKRLANFWSVIQPSDALRAEAAQLVDRYDLRVAAAFQLAAASEWCEDAPHRRVFLTADRRLRVAARSSGFHAIEMWPESI